MIYLFIFTLIGFIVVMGWIYRLSEKQDTLSDRIDNLENNLSSEDTLSELLSKWDEAYANSDKYQRRMMTINRQRYGIKTAAEMHGVI